MKLPNWFHFASLYEKRPADLGVRRSSIMRNAIVMDLIDKNPPRDVETTLCGQFFVCVFIFGQNWIIKSGGLRPQLLLLLGHLHVIIFQLLLPGLKKSHFSGYQTPNLANYNHNGNFSFLSINTIFYEFRKAVNMG